jgi:hypothetical protein
MSNLFSEQSYRSLRIALAIFAFSIQLYVFIVMPFLVRIKVDANYRT